MLQVIITVTDGVADVLECPKGIEVVIRDYDLSTEEGPKYKTDAQGEVFGETIFTS